MLCDFVSLFSEILRKEIDIILADDIYLGCAEYYHAE
jgi:hypothetical protein